MNKIFEEMSRRGENIGSIKQNQVKNENLHLRSRP